jgi:hypothetical protein
LNTNTLALFRLWQEQTGSVSMKLFFWYFIQNLYEFLTRVLKTRGILHVLIWTMLTEGVGRPAGLFTSNSASNPGTQKSWRFVVMKLLGSKLAFGDANVPFGLFQGSLRWFRKFFSGKEHRSIPEAHQPQSIFRIFSGFATISQFLLFIRIIRRIRCFVSLLSKMRSNQVQNGSHSPIQPCSIPFSRHFDGVEILYVAFLVDLKPNMTSRGNDWYRTNLERVSDVSRCDR